MRGQAVTISCPKTVMLKQRLRFFFVVIVGLACLTAVQLHVVRAEDPRTDWKAGVASVVITPEQSMWMAGYAARTKPSEGKVHDLRAKALALEDARGTRLVIVAVDILGIPRALRDRLEKESGQRYGLPPEGLLLNASHTHCGPEVNELMAVVWGVPTERVRQSQEYVKALQQKLLRLVGEAIDSLGSSRLAYTHARAGFAMNRRLKTDGGFVIRPQSRRASGSRCPRFASRQPGRRIASRFVRLRVSLHHPQLLPVLWRLRRFRATVSGRGPSGYDGSVHGRVWGRPKPVPPSYPGSGGAARPRLSQWSRSGIDLAAASARRAVAAGP